MAYIRTESGKIFTDESWKKREDYEKIVQESDSIEHLCDLFVVGKSGYRKFSSAKSVKEILKLGDDKPVYGAIWVSDGLKYVAKMNDKGELELL